MLENFYLPFEEKFSVNDVKKITTEKLNNVAETPNLIIKTIDKEYILKNEASSYFVKNNTIYGKGKCRLINIKDRFESIIEANLNKAEEI